LHTAPGANPTLAADAGTAFPLMINASLAVGAGSIAATAPIWLRFRSASSQWILQYSGGASIAASVVAGSVTNASLSNAAAWTLKGNPTGGSAAPTDFTIDSLTAKATPAAVDEVAIWDAAGAAMKKATLSTVIAAATPLRDYLGGLTLSGGGSQTLTINAGEV